MFIEDSRQALDIMMNKTDMVPTLKKLTVYQGKQEGKQYIKHYLFNYNPKVPGEDRIKNLT